MANQQPDTRRKLERDPRRSFSALVVDGEIVSRAAPRRAAATRLEHGYESAGTGSPPNQDRASASREPFVCARRDARRCERRCPSVFEYVGKASTQVYDDGVGHHELLNDSNGSAARALTGYDRVVELRSDAPDPGRSCPGSPAGDVAKDRSDPGNSNARCAGQRRALRGVRGARPSGQSLSPVRQGASPRNEASPGRAPRAIGSLGSGHFVARNHARTFLAKPLRNLATQVVDLGVQGPASRRNFFLLARQLLKALCEFALSEVPWIR